MSYASTRRFAFIVSVNIVVFAALLSVFEGAVSVWFVAAKLARDEIVAERLHTEYDPTIGWINQPNLRIPDMYGPGKSLQTNAQRFRNDRDFEKSVPAGKVRLICSGDSFALGYGVDNDLTWCQLLEKEDGRLESVNLGQGGYGIDQAYLWFQHNSALLDFNVHVFTFTWLDFERMKDRSFAGHGKPVLELREGRLTVDNVPVPRLPSVVRRLARAADVGASLKAVRLVKGLLGMTEKRAASENAKVRTVTARVFAELKRLNESKHSALLLVHLPMLGDYMGGSPADEWRRFAAAIAADNNIQFLDLTLNFRKLPPTEIRQLYLTKDSTRRFQNAAGHYNEHGNQLVAKLIFQKVSMLTAGMRSLGDVKPL